MRPTPRRAGTARPAREPVEHQELTGRQQTGGVARNQRRRGDRKEHLSGTRARATFGANRDYSKAPGRAPQHGATDHPAKKMTFRVDAGVSEKNAFSRRRPDDRMIAPPERGGDPVDLPSR